MQLLTPGNIVTSGLQIYRSRFKTYFLISLIAHLWLIIPLLGWAKFFAHSALISRLVFQEIMENSEVWQSAQKQVNRKLAAFLFSAFAVAFVVYIGFNLLLIIVGIIAIATSQFLYSSIYVYVPKNDLMQVLAFLTYVLFLILLTIVFITVSISLYAQFFLTEVILAVEERVNMWGALKKSNGLINTYGFRPQLVIAIATLVCLPILVFNQIILEILDLIINYFNLHDSQLFTILIISLFGLINILLLPFWQAIKAVVYYDIHNRQQGLNLLLRSEAAAQRGTKTL